jgi:hypothetical protein
MAKIVRKKLPKVVPETYKNLNAKPLPTGIVHQDRMVLFSPYVRLSKDQLATKANPVTVETSFGIVIFEDGLLDQTHRDILQILFTFPNEFSMKLFYDAANRERRSFEFTPYQMSKYLGINDANRSWILEKLHEMYKCSFTLIPKINEAQTTEALIRHFKGKSARGQVYTSILHFVKEKDSGKIEIEISPFFLEAYNFDTAVHTEKLTVDLLKLEEGYNKALVHHCLTHSDRTFSLKMLMANIGLPTYEENSVLYNRYRNYITKPENQEKLKKFGITFEQRNPFKPKEWHVNIETSSLKGKVWTDNHQQLAYLEPHKDTDKIEKVIKKK